MAIVEYSLGSANVSELAALYDTYGWWADRDEDGIRRALAETDEAIALRDEDTEELLAAARVLTDYTYYAMVFDVIVDVNRRGEGFGQELMAAVIDHPALSGVTPTLLAREGLVEFYESCGFEETEPVSHPDGEPEPLRFLSHRRND